MVTGVHNHLGYTLQRRHPGHSTSEHSSSSVPTNMLTNHYEALCTDNGHQEFALFLRFLFEVGRLVVHLKKNSFTIEL